MLLIKAGLAGQEGEKRRTDRETESAHVAKGRDGEVRCGLLKRNPGEGVSETDTQRERKRERDQLHIRLDDYEEVVKNSDGDDDANSA